MTILPASDPGSGSCILPTGPLQKRKHGSNLADPANPALLSSELAYETTDLVEINDEGVKAAARHIAERLEVEAYTPRTWRSHALHLCPPEPYDPSHPQTKKCFDWLFLIASLNFSFWSEYEGTPDRFGVEWRGGWGSEDRVVHTGYWSLVAAVDRALEEGIPITDPKFYASESRCPDSLIAHVFRAAPHSKESIPLLAERISILRQNGEILCKRFGGSFQIFYESFMRTTNSEGTALQLVKLVADTFPTFQDETVYDGQRCNLPAHCTANTPLTLAPPVCLWKRAQILVAETWAAFYPPSPADAHPLFPGAHGAAMHQLTMFADYRVPQILHHLGILSYPPALCALLRGHAPLAPGSREEVSIRAASIVAVERMRRAMVRPAGAEEASGVLIDFYLWDLAKKIEIGEERVEGLTTNEMLPAHRTRSIWY